MQPRLASRSLAGRSALLLAVAAVFFGIMVIVAKDVERRLPGAEVAFIRFAIGLAGCGLAAGKIRFRFINNRVLFLRGAFGGSAVLCFFLAIEHLPVGVATLLNYTAPVFTALWAALFLGEPLGLGTLGALALTVLGVGLVIYGQAPPGELGFGPWQLVGILSAVLSGAAVTCVRAVRRTDGPWEIFAAFCLIGMLVTGVPTAEHYLPPSGRDWLLLGAVGLLSLIAQLLMAYSLRYVKAAVGGILLQLTPVAALALGYFLYAEPMPLLSLAGAAVTVGGVSAGAWLASTPEEEP